MDDTGYFENLIIVARKMGTDVLIQPDLLEMLLNKIKEQEATLKEYHKADGFLACHGWLGNKSTCPVLKEEQGEKICRNI